MAKIHKNVSPDKNFIFVDFTKFGSHYMNKESDLHKFKAVPIADGNRAERRAYKKAKKKK
jgi:hypothetical protein